MRTVAIVSPFGPGETSGDRRWAATLWAGRARVAMLTVLVVAPITVITLIGTLSWVGKPFPGFFVLDNGVIPTVGVYQWTGMAAGVPFHARVVEIDGQPFRGPNDLYARARSVPLGTSIHYMMVKGDRVDHVSVPTMPFGWIDYWLSVGLMEFFGVASVALGLLVYLLAPPSLTVSAFFAQGVITGLFAITGTALYHPALTWLTVPHLVAQCAFPSAFIDLGLVFPTVRRFVARRSAWLLAPYAITVPLSIYAWTEFYASPPRMTSLYLAYLYSAASIVILLALTTFAYWENAGPRVRRQLRSVLPGLLIGTGVGLYGFLNTAQSGGNFPINLIAMTPFLFYLSIGYAIAQHDLFDVDTLIKQSIVYGTLTIAVTGIYVAAVTLVSRLEPLLGGIGSGTVQIAFVMLVAALFAPLKTGVQHIVDRTFYRARLDHGQTIRELSAALTSLLDLDDILHRVGSTLLTGLQTTSTTIALWSEEGARTWRYDAARGRMVGVDVGRIQALRDELTQRPHMSVVRVTPESEHGAPEAGALHRDLEQLDAHLLVPLMRAGTAIGVIGLGSKRSGRPYTRADLQLIGTLAAQSAIAIENARSYRALQAANEQLEHRVRARTADLQRSNTDLTAAYAELKATHGRLVQSEKMASLGVLVAGVAHEINNPVSFIINNMEPLRELIAHVEALTAREDDPAMRQVLRDMTEAVDVITRGAERTAGVVKDLRTFSRLSDERAELLDLHEHLEVTLRLLRPRFGDRITVHRDYGPLPPVESAPGQLNQVFMNVLANACDAIDGAGNLWIVSRSDGEHVTITIRDDGSGIEAEDLGRIFDPFFTTKPQGKGTGLGLAISHGIMENHGGRIEVESRPGAGTTVTLVLPVRKSKSSATA